MSMTLSTQTSYRFAVLFEIHRLTCTQFDCNCNYLFAHCIPLRGVTKGFMLLSMTSNEQNKRAFSGAPASSGRPLENPSVAYQAVSASRYVTPTAVPQHNRVPSPNDQVDPGKRTRSESGDLYSINTETTTSSFHKKTRQNDYISPRKIPTTFTSTVGSLVGGNASVLPWTGGEGNRRIHLRKQLSGSKVEDFLSSETDAMDVDPADSRPRSMSF